MSGTGKQRKNSLQDKLDNTKNEISTNIESMNDLETEVTEKQEILRVHSAG